MNIISTDVNYTYDIMQLDIRNLLIKYPFLNSGIIGISVLGKNIPYIRIGVGGRQVCYSSSIHGNEWITSVLLMKFIENFSEAYNLNTNIEGYNAKEIFNTASIYIVPMVNPDGVDLVTGAIAPNSLYYNLAEKIANNYPQIDFPSGWKANIKGVDLNLQFPAGWEDAKRIKFEQGFFTPAPRDFVGYGPLTEPESLALYNFTLEKNFYLIIAFHTQGQEIYWQFKDYEPPRAEEIALQFERVSGYALTEVPYNSSFAGYKDWFIQDYNRPGYTVEAGLGTNPLPISQFDEIYRDNIGILLLGAIV